MQILNTQQIGQKIRRLAMQILEENYQETSLVIGGINNNGFAFAELIHKELSSIDMLPIELVSIRLNPAKPLQDKVTFSCPIEDLEDKCIIIVDDVANTGRTLFYAMKPLMNVVPRKVEMAVLVDREHKSFPVKVDYVGMSLATTLKDHIDVQIFGMDNPAVFLR